MTDIIKETYYKNYCKCGSEPHKKRAVKELKQALAKARDEYIKNGENCIKKEEHSPKQVREHMLANQTVKGFCKFLGLSEEGE